MYINTLSMNVIHPMKSGNTDQKPFTDWQGRKLLVRY